VRLLPQAGSIQYRYGLALYVNGQKDQALEHLLKAAELEPKNFEYVQGATLILKSLKRWDDAALWARKLLEISPENNSAALGIIDEIERRIP
jgi:tetratricopeptide (TPR) repeat protein